MRAIDCIDPHVSMIRQFKTHLGAIFSFALAASY
jgi:hypothetical protein